MERFRVFFWKHDLVSVRVKDRVLWIGNEAYPLQNIARARTVWLERQTGREVYRFLRFAVLVLIVGGLIDLVAGSSTFASVVFTVGVLALIGWRLLRLIKFLNSGRLYALMIETAGTPRRGLVSSDRYQLEGIVEGVMHAINNPQAEFQVMAEYVHVGDNFAMIGDHNIGKQVQ